MQCTKIVATFIILLISGPCGFIESAAVVSGCTRLTIEPAIDDYEKIIDRSFVEPIIVSKIYHVSDVIFEKKEFDYLVDFKSETPIDAAALKRAIGYLIKKNKFQKIDLCFNCTDAGIVLVFYLYGFWTFERVTFRGVMTGKDRFRHYYALQPGNRFDEEKHTASLKSMREAFCDEGYFEATVTDQLLRNEDLKSVVAKIVLARNARFYIRGVDVERVRGARVGGDSESVCAKAKKFLLKKLEGVAYTKKQVEEEVQHLKQHLSKKGYMYIDVDVERSIDYATKTIDLRCYLDLHHKREFIFLGNHFFSEQDLLDRILVFGRSTWLLPPTILSEELLKAYEQRGFWQATIDAREENERYFFIIKEGVRSGIDAVVLENAEQCEVQEVVRDCFGELLKLSYYDEDVLKQSYEKLVQWYARRGFWQAAILKEEYKKQEGDRYVLHVILDEGECSMLTRVSIPDFEYLESEGPFKQIGKLTAPIVLEPKMVAQQRQWLCDYFQKEGFLHAHIKHAIRNEDDGVVLEWLVDPGQKVYFGKTIMLDTSGFPFESVLHELAYKEGELWDREKLKQSMLNFKELDIFDAVHLYPSDIASQDTEKAIMLRLQKDDPFEVRTRFGVGIQQIDRYFHTAGLTYKLGGTFIMKNPCNYGDQLKLEADFSRSRRSVVIGYRLPRLGTIPARTVFKGFSSKFLYPGCIGISKNLYQIKQEGFLTGFRSVRRWWDAGLNIGVEVLRTTLSDNLDETRRMADQVAQAINFDPALLGIYIPYVVFEPAIMLNNLDNNANPTKGTFSLFSMKGMIPFGRYKRDAYFVKMIIEQSFFISLRPFVLVLHARIGHIFLQNFRYIMPSERLYLGGSNSIRSYVTDRCPPLGIVKDDCGKEHVVPQGGKSLLNLNFELRFPIFQGFGGVIFQDFGFLSDTHFAAVPRKNALTATGLGIYYVTPIGPLRFDFAFKWYNDVPTSRPYAWYLTFGHPF